LSRSVTVLGNAVQFVPASLYQEWIETAFGPDAIIVGFRTILIPKGTSAEGEPYLLDRLADYLVAQKLVNDGRVEMNFTQGSLTGTPPQDGTPSYQVMKSARGVEVSFVLTGSNGSSVSGRVTLPTSDVASAKSGVKSGSQVRVVFHKGPITVEVPGKTLAAASVGENVGVFIAESQRTFTGRVIDGKAVQVDLL
jgi:ribosomal 50S subunit-recycling heat shock protein